MTQRRKFTPEFKARVVLEMLTEQKSAAQVSREYGIKDSVLSRWKQEFIEQSPQLFEQGTASDDRDQRIAELERMVGRLAMEQSEDWLTNHRYLNMQVSEEEPLALKSNTLISAQALAT